MLFGPKAQLAFLLMRAAPTAFLPPLQQPKAGSPKECKSAANRVHVAFGSQEEEDGGLALPDPDRPPSPVCPALGTISFFYEGVVHSAKQSPSGAG